MSKMKHKETRIKWKNADFYFLYTLSFAGLAFFLYRIFAVNGKSFAWDPDGVTQHINALAYYGRYLRNILHTIFVDHRLSIPMWDLSIGYGSDIITTLHYYVIGDPLALLSVFFRSSQGETLYTFLWFLRVYLAGIAFSRYAFYHKNSKQAVFMGTLIYTFAGWTIYATIKHPYFANPLIYLPFILMGIDKIYKKEKPYVFIWSVAIAGLSNFYFFYMIGIFMVLYAVVRYFEMFQKFSLKNIGKWLGIFCVYSIIAVLIAAVILLPVIMPILGTDRFKAENYVPLFYDSVYYKKYLASLIGDNMAQWGTAGFTAIAMTGVFVLFSKRKKYRGLKIGFILMNIFLLVPFMGHALNGFSYVSNRWVWGYVMLIGYIFVKIYPEIFTLTLKEKKRILIFLLIYCGIALFPDVARTQRNLAAEIMLVMGTFIVLSYGSLIQKKRNLNILMTIVLIAGVLFNMYYQYSYERGYLEEFSDKDDTLAQLETPADLTILASGDTNLYRYDQAGTNHKENSSLLMGTHSTAYYFSVASQYISNYFSELYLNAPREHRYDTLDGRTMLERLASVKYFVVRDGNERCLPYGYDKFAAGNVKDDIMYKAYTDENVLPLGYTYDSYISSAKYAKMSATEKQQAMMQGVVLEDSSLPETNLTFNDQEIPYKLTLGEGCEVQDGKIVASKGGAKAVLEFDGLDSSETYLQVEGIDFEALSPRERIGEEEWEKKTAYEQQHILYNDRKWDRWKNSERSRITITGDKTSSRAIQIFTSKYNMYSGRQNFIFNTGYSKTGKKNLTLTFKEAGIYTLDNLKVICQPMTNVESQTKKLGEEVLTDIKMQDNEFTGKISVSKDKALLLALPYSTGFTAYVDGKKTDIKQANTMYMAVELSKGEHEIRLTYCTPYLKAGLLLTCLGLLCYICVVLIYKKKRGNKKE